MTQFIGGSKTLIVEADDATFARHDRILKQFPEQVNLRARNADEARQMLAEDPSIQIVTIDGQAWTPTQALEILASRA